MTGTSRWRLALVYVTTVTVLAVVGDAQPAHGAPARCAWLRPHLEAAGLPVETFMRISYRESLCARRGVRVSDVDDLSTSRFGANFRTAALRRYWRHACGATHWTQLGASVALDVKCTAAAFRDRGLAPWR